MQIARCGSRLLLIVLCCGFAAAAQDSSSPAAQPAMSSTVSTSPASAQSNERTVPPATLNDVLDRVVQREHFFMAQMRHMHPLVETYLQSLKTDSTGHNVPVNDRYFLGRLEMSDGPEDVSFVGQPGFGQRMLSKLTGVYSLHYLPMGFAQMVFLDSDFQKKYYKFNFVRREFLGELRCLVIDVQPREGDRTPRFKGRIWVEDQDYNIVRFTGTYTAKSYAKRSFHFDSWRLNTISIMWTPAYVYTEESDPKDPTHHTLWFKAQTRVWGYDLANAGDHKEYAKQLTDNAATADPNRHEASQSLNPDLTLGANTYSADDKVVERLQVAGLMAPDGNVNHILETVVNNILVTNDLDIPAVRCRILLTTPLESFVMGRTIVLSRGLVDVLPDEASLAAVLSHELAHIVLNHSTGEKFLSGLALPFPDLEIFSHLNFHFDAPEEAAADKKGIELFGRSPYKDKLAPAELFLEALDARSSQLPNLLHGRLSNDFASSHLVGMTAQAKTLKQLQVDQVDQSAALPLGSRIALDSWSDKIDLMRGQSAHPVTAAEKRPFEVGPFYPYLKRLETEKAPAAAPAK